MGGGAFPHVPLATHLVVTLFWCRDEEVRRQRDTHGSEMCQMKSYVPIRQTM